MEQTLHGYSVNPLYRYISTVFGKEETERLFALYKVGTSKKWGGSTIFWQIDVNGNVRTGKIMKYDDKTGHRIKEPHSLVTWVHSELKLPDFTLRQCFFGEHLLTDKTKTIAIVEINPAKRNVLDLKNETCKNREKRNVLKKSHTRHFNRVGGKC